MTTEDKVRIIFETPMTVSLAALAQQVELSPEAVRKILSGRLYAKVLPEIERYSTSVRTLRCWACKMASRPKNDRWRRQEGDRFLWCSLGYPESADPRYARECPAFMAAAFMDPLRIR